MDLMMRRHILMQNTASDSNILNQSDTILSKYIQAGFGVVTINDSQASNVIRNACFVESGKTYIFSYTADTLNSSNQRGWIVVAADGETVLQNIITNVFTTGNGSYSFSITATGTLWITVDKNMTNMQIVKQ